MKENQPYLYSNVHCFLLANRRIAYVVMLFTCLAISQPAFCAVGSTSASAAPCHGSAPQVDITTDVHAFDEYRGAITKLLEHERFADLDCLANQARTEKTRFPGGAWQLRFLYIGLHDFQVHATEIDYRNRIRHLQNWIAARPTSITARIGLAELYTSYGWAARGEDDSDTVSQSGWQLFAVRLKKAHQILDEASALTEKCPEWYPAMMTVALGEEWPPERVEVLLEKAVAFEPAYDAIYREHAHYLLPQWNGADGDTEKFAQEMADRIGGSDGDMMYFWMAKELVCCDDKQFKAMSWPRVQKGYEALEKKYGESLVNINAYAMMAEEHDDDVLADALFKKIGDQWDKDIWKTETYFKSRRDISAEWGPRELIRRANEHEAAVNMQSAEGALYLEAFQPKLVEIAKRCQEAAAHEPVAFEFLIKVGEKGEPADGYTIAMPQGASCLLGEFRTSFRKKETVFPPPPKPGYWLQFNIDASMVVVAAK